MDLFARSHGLSDRESGDRRRCSGSAWTPGDRGSLFLSEHTVNDHVGERCVVHLGDGSAHEAVLRRVGADFVEATVGEGRTVLVAFGALAAVQSRD